MTKQTRDPQVSAKPTRRTFADVINVLANATTVVFQPGGVNK